MVTVPAAGTLTRNLSLDSSIGRDTRLVFTYTNGIDVSISTSQANSAQYIYDNEFSLTTIRVDGIVVSERYCGTEFFVNWEFFNGADGH